MTLRQARAALQGAADPRRAVFLRSYFKTSSGEYGAGDVFIGVPVPALRAIAKRHRALPRRDLGRLLRSRINEERALALEILILQQGQANGGAARIAGQLLLATPARREQRESDRWIRAAFLRAHHARMPRTMLRYAIERLPEAQRRAYLRGGPAGPFRARRAAPGHEKTATPAVD